jgi:hypothetical protein
MDAGEALEALESDEGERAVAAARVLLRGRESTTLVPLVRRLAREELGTPLHDTLLKGLREWGGAVAPFVLEALAAARTGEERSGLLCVLASCGVRDERIYTALLAQLREEPIPGVMNLCVYGDARALGPLTRALEECPLEGEADVFAWQTVIELEAAIIQLGGGLEAAQRERVERARRLRQPLMTWLEQRQRGAPTDGLPSGGRVGEGGVPLEGGTRDDE